MEQRFSRFWTDSRVTVCFPCDANIPHARLLPSCVEVLLTAGAAVDVATRGGHTSLFLACESGSLDCVRVLLSAGADPSCTAAVSLLCESGRLMAPFWIL